MMLRSGLCSFRNRDLLLDWACFARSGLAAGRPERPGDHRDDHENERADYFFGAIAGEGMRGSGAGHVEEDARVSPLLEDGKPGREDCKCAKDFPNAENRSDV